MIRDQALAVSGLLVEKVGGPSVKPYQPEGLWADMVEGGYGDYVQETGDDLYRRSLYTFWKRTLGPPTMMTFDASTRETCIVRTGRTNTPLQALNLMNDVTYVEAARRLAERMMTEGGETPEDRIGYAYLLSTAHRPPPAAREILVDGYRGAPRPLPGRPRRRPRARQPGRIRARRDVGRGRTGVLHHGRQPHPELRRHDHEGIGRSRRNSANPSATRPVAWPGGVARDGRHRS